MPKVQVLTPDELAEMFPIVVLVDGKPTYFGGEAKDIGELRNQVRDFVQEVNRRST